MQLAEDIYCVFFFRRDIYAGLYNVYDESKLQVPHFRCLRAITAFFVPKTAWCTLKREEKCTILYSEAVLGECDSNTGTDHRVNGYTSTHSESVPASRMQIRVLNYVTLVRNRASSDMQKKNEPCRRRVCHTPPPHPIPVFTSSWREFVLSRHRKHKQPRRVSLFCSLL